MGPIVYANGLVLVVEAKFDLVFILYGENGHEFLLFGVFLLFLLLFLLFLLKDFGLGVVAFADSLQPMPGVGRDCLFGLCLFPRS
jgi:hypothetical protein